MAAGDVLRSFPSPAGNTTGLAWDGRALWHADYVSDRIYQIDPESGLVLRWFASPAAIPKGLAWAGRALWNADANTVRIYQVAVA